MRAAGAGAPRPAARRGHTQCHQVPRPWAQEAPVAPALSSEHLQMVTKRLPCPSAQPEAPRWAGADVPACPRVQLRPPRASPSRPLGQSSSARLLVPGGSSAVGGQRWALTAALAACAAVPVSSSSAHTRSCQAVVLAHGLHSTRTPHSLGTPGVVSLYFYLTFLKNP